MAPGTKPTPEPEAGQVTQLLIAWSGGDRSALDQLMPLVYRELRRLAAAFIRRERTGHTLQPTALVHEAYLRLVKQSAVESRSRAKFFAVAANLMRQILINHARRNRAGKRGGGRKEQLQDSSAIAQPEVDLLALNEALEKLAKVDPRKSHIVELRFFGGLTEDQIAEVLDVSPITVKRDWRVARAVLQSHLGENFLDRV
ncbi:MAG TPA: sigma-70 family RNA polymerase sigma factor [Bryobacteraceae bacterium]|nr:sigma-70 family RNA polymerase sigma factor [Bryobacteraceae bacterium]